METVLLNEIIEKSVYLEPEERRRLIRVLQEQERRQKTNGETKTNGGKSSVHPNTLWIKENHAEYQGKYVAVDNGKLVGTGKNFPEALAEAKKNGSEKPMVTYLFPLDSEPFGGW